MTWLLSCSMEISVDFNHEPSEFTDSFTLSADVSVLIIEKKNIKTE